MKNMIKKFGQVLALAVAFVTTTAWSDPVATVDGTPYDDISSAWSAWTANGGTLTLLQDVVNVTAGSYVAKDAILDLGGKSLTFADAPVASSLNINGGVSLTVKNGTICSGKSKNDMYLIHAVAKGVTLTVESVHAKSFCAFCYAASNKGVKFIIKDSTFVHYTSAEDGKKIEEYFPPFLGYLGPGSEHIIEISGDCVIEGGGAKNGWTGVGWDNTVGYMEMFPGFGTITISGGKFTKADGTPWTGLMEGEPGHDYLTPGCSFDPVTGKVEPAPVVKIVETDKGYPSLAKAYAAAEAGQTIKLVSKVVLDAPFQVGKKITLDLATFNFEAAAGCNAIEMLVNGEITINADATNPGHIKCDAGKRCIYADKTLSAGKKVITINGGVFDGACVFNEWGSAHAEQERGTENNCKATINGGLFNEEVIGYRCYPFTVNGGTFEKRCECGTTSTFYSHYNGGKFKIEPGSNNPDVIGIGVTDSRKGICISDAVCFEADGYFHVIKTADIPADAAVKVGTTCYYMTLADALVHAMTTADDNRSVLTLLKDVSFDGLTLPLRLTVAVGGTTPTGTLAPANENYVIVEKDGVFMNVGALAQIGDDGEKFASVKEAMDEAEEGDTVKLLANTDEKVTIKGGVTFKLNGFTSGAVSADFGWKVVENDGVYTLEPEYCVRIVQANAVTKDYQFIKDAVAAAQEGDTIVLLSDISAGTVTGAASGLLPMGGSTETTWTDPRSSLNLTGKGGVKVVFDLNGHEMVSKFACVTLGDNNDLTVIDSSAEQNGRFFNKGGQATVIFSGNNAKLTLESGTIAQEDTQTAAIRCMNISDDSGYSTGNSVVLLGGTVEGFVEVANSDSTPVVVDGGAIVCAAGAAIRGGSNAASTESDGIQISGASRISAPKLVQDSKLLVTIRGGEFIGLTEIAPAGARVYISGGLYNVDPTAFVIDGYAVVQDEDGMFVVVRGEVQVERGESTQVEPEGNVNPTTPKAVKAIEDAVIKAQQEVVESGIDKVIGTGVNDAVMKKAGDGYIVKPTIVERLKAAAIGAGQDPDEITTETEVVGTVKMKLDAVVKVYEETGVTLATVTKLLYEVKPYAEYTYRTLNAQGKTIAETTVSTPIENSEIDAPIRFTLALLSDAIQGEIVKVTHKDGNDIKETLYPDVYVKDGKRYVDIEFSTFSDAIVEETDVTEFEAKVGTSNFATLAEALSHADGKTVVPLKNVTVDATLSVVGNVTLDLSGKTIGGAADPLFAIPADATLRVTGVGQVEQAGELAATGSRLAIAGGVYAREIPEAFVALGYELTEDKKSVQRIDYEEIDPAGAELEDDVVIDTRDEPRMIELNADETFAFSDLGWGEVIAPEGQAGVYVAKDVAATEFTDITSAVTEDRANLVWSADANGPYYFQYRFDDMTEDALFYATDLITQLGPNGTVQAVSENGTNVDYVVVTLLNDITKPLVIGEPVPVHVDMNGWSIRGADGTPAVIDGVPAVIVKNETQELYFYSSNGASTLKGGNGYGGDSKGSKAVVLASGAPMTTYTYDADTVSVLDAVTTDGTYWAWATGTMDCEESAYPAGVSTKDGKIYFFQTNSFGAAKFDFAAVGVKAIIPDHTIHFITGVIPVEGLEATSEAADELVFVGAEGELATTLLAVTNKSAFAVNALADQKRSWQNLVFTCDETVYKTETLGMSGGAIRQIGGQLSVEGCVFTNCVANLFGGAIAAVALDENSAITNSVFGWNRTAVTDPATGEWFDFNGEGGALYASAAKAGVSFDLVGTTFMTNSADNGSAIACDASAYDSAQVEAELPIALTISQSTFSGNKGWDSGAIYTCGNVTIDDGIADEADPSEFDRTEFIGNTALNGGAIWVFEPSGLADIEPPTVQISKGARFVENIALNAAVDGPGVTGGAIAFSTPNCTFVAKGVEFTRNIAQGIAEYGNIIGGALALENTASVEIDTCVFDGNMAIDSGYQTYMYGGAVDIYNTPSAVIVNSTFRNSNIEAVNASWSTVAITNCVLIGNGETEVGETEEEKIKPGDIRVIASDLDIAYTAYGSMTQFADDDIECQVTETCNLVGRSAAEVYAGDTLKLRSDIFNPVAALGLPQAGVRDFVGTEYGTLNQEKISGGRGSSMGAYETPSVVLMVTLTGDREYNGFTTSNGCDFVFTYSTNGVVLPDGFYWELGDLANAFVVDSWTFGKKDIGYYASTNGSPMTVAAALSTTDPAKEYLRRALEFVYEGTIRPTENGLLVVIDPVEYAWKDGNEPVYPDTVKVYDAFNGDELVLGTDYTLGYADHDKGPTAKAKAIATGLGNFAGGVSSSNYWITAYCVQHAFDDEVDPTFDEMHGEVSPTVVAGVPLTATLPEGYCYDWQNTVATGAVTRIDAEGKLKTLTMLYYTDKNGDGVPDKFQKHLLEKVANGKWTDTEDKYDRELYVTLTKGQIQTGDVWVAKWDASGTGTIDGSALATAGTQPDSDYTGTGSGWLAFDKDGKLTVVSNWEAFEINNGTFPFVMYAYLRKAQGGHQGGGRTRPGAGSGSEGTSYTLEKMYKAEIQMANFLMTGNKKAKFTLSAKVTDTTSNKTVAGGALANATVNVSTAESLDGEWSTLPVKTDSNGQAEVDASAPSGFFTVGE